MDTPAALFGSDLRLFADLQHQSDRADGSDLHVVRRPVTGHPATDPLDLETLAGVGNLQQALLMRFRTHLGELAALGHPDYGSRLSELIGQLNVETTRHLAKLYTLEALAGEPRIRQVLSVEVQPHPADRTRVDITVSLLAIDSPSPLNLVFPLLLSGSSVS